MHNIIKCIKDFKKRREQNKKNHLTKVSHDEGLSALKILATLEFAKKHNHLRAHDGTFQL